MRFYYIASDPSGKVSEGDIEAQSPASALEWIVSQGLRPVSLKALGGVEGAKGLFGKTIHQAITIEDKVFLTKYLALMLRVGTDLFKAIDILIADFDKPAVKSLLLEMKDTLGKGHPFYTTFAKYPKYFSAVFVSLIRAGEESGNLEKVFERLSTDLERQWDLHNRIKSTLVYPVVLVVLSLVVLFLMVTFALPQIAETFTSSGTIEPPLFSRVVFAVGLFLRSYILVIIPIIIGSVVWAWIFFRKTISGRRIVERASNRLPVIKGVLFRISLQRFASTLSSLLRSGSSILEALETTADAVGSAELRAALLRISREGITRGLTVGEAFRREMFFPRVVVNLIAISEKTGHMEDVLETLADFYESEIDASIKTLVSFLEPALLLVIGLVVGTIALSIIIPVYQLVGTI